MVEKIVNPFRYLFYVVNPQSEMYDEFHQVPDYITEAIPGFVGLVILELFVMLWKNMKAWRVNDAVTSLSQGILMEQSKVLFRGAMFFPYLYVHKNHRIVDIDAHSSLNWIIALVVIDFAYYWFHRACHEINILWAAHQVHHSAEDYNLTTALRQSIVQPYFHAVLYVPLALVLPPPLFLVHHELNLLFQFWIHTQFITSLGPLDYILNTPSHHRVHHGRNRYCIDKNYAGVFIVWDIMFGTFVKESDTVVYGLTHPLETFNPFHVQLCHTIHICKTFKSTPGWRNKLSVLFKGPGWEPGKPRLGLIEDIPDVKAPMPKHDPPSPLWCKVYVMLHFFIALWLHAHAVHHKNVYSIEYNLLSLVFIYYSLTCFGFMNDSKPYAFTAEWLRCLIFLMFFSTSTWLQTSNPLSTAVANVVFVIFNVSFLACGAVLLNRHIKVKKV